jgi:hypothetical protein
MMLLKSSRRSRWAAHLLAPLSAALMAVVAAPASAAMTQAGTEAPQASFVLPAKPSEMLRAPAATWKPLLVKVGAALDERGKAVLLLGKPALIELNVQRTVFAQSQRAWPAVFDAVKKTRQLQDGEAGRQTAGLLNEVLARQAANRGDAAWLQRHLRDQVLAMRWTEVEPTIRTLRQQLASMKADAIETYVINKLDLSANVAENKASLGFVMQLLAMRFQLQEVMPRQDALVAGLDEAIAQRGSAAASAVGK